VSAVEAIQEILRRRFGLLERATWKHDWARALAELGPRYGHDAAELLAAVDRDPAALRELAAYFCVHETFFLRHPDHFTAICDHAVALLDERTGGTPVRIWSAGCSTGEEPYSVVIALWERLGRDPEERVETLASDISAAAIAQARAATYSAWSFRGVPDHIKTRYFEAAEAGLRLRGEVRQRVRFEVAPIEDRIAVTPGGSVDVVLWRNVGIYLEDAALERVFNGLRRIVKTTGLLIVAPGDPRPPKELFVLDAAGSEVYRPRPEEARPAARELPLPPPAAPPAARRPRPLPAAVETPRAPVAAALAAGAPASRPGDAASRLLRGQLRLAAGELHAAVQELRSAVFIAPHDPLARFWYASALEASGLLAQARRQLELIAEQLAGLADGTVLADGETSAEELRTAVRSGAERLNPSQTEGAKK
jgi:chemotaxis protein methyltransferase CheR